MKTAIVTGASSGIGLEICKMLLQHDYQVYGFGRCFDHVVYDSGNDSCATSIKLCTTADDLDKSVVNHLNDFSNHLINNNSHLFHPIACDLMNTQDLIKEIKQIQKEHKIDLLINNAGAGYFGPHEELNAQKIHALTVTNLEVPMLLCQILLRDLKQTKGTIINMSSITAKKSNTYGCAYGATKAGLTSFSKSLFDEVRKYGVKVCVIHPDMTKTNFYRNANFKEGDVPESYLLPEEIANAVEFIITSREGFVPTDLTFQPQIHRLTKLK